MSLQRQKEASHPESTAHNQFSNKQILATAFGNGSTHDFQLFKNSRSHIAANILCLADSGYQGIAHLHVNSRTLPKNQNSILLLLSRNRSTASWLPSVLRLSMLLPKSKSFVFCLNATETAVPVSPSVSTSLPLFIIPRSVLNSLLQEVY